MKAPLSWLKEYTDINVDIETLCKKMVDIGLEIEGVEYLADKIHNIVVGQILEISKHPDADKLNCCVVDIGSEAIPIVTNSQSVKVGDKIAVALDKAKTANGMSISKGKMRGEPSHGMLCGAEELGITKDFYPNADTDGVLILNENAQVGQNVASEVGLDDYILDISVTSNRQDCNSIYGLAREVAVALGSVCRPLELSFVENSQQTSDYVEVSVEAPDLCPNYFMQGVVDVSIEQSPLWMTQRLAKVGLHGINNLVDITNYVLMEVGQPMHAFDYKDINDKAIVVRRAKNDETIVPLDGKTYQLNSENLVIADKRRAVGLAGIMGGMNSGVKLDTTVVMLESAKFARSNIRRSSRQLGLRSDSSARFEKGIDAFTTQTGLSRALHLIEQLKCGKILSGRISICAVKVAEKIVEFDKGKIKQLLGIEIDDKRVEAILNSLNIETSIKGNAVRCNVPPYRDDILEPCDIIEEIIRIHGYDNISGRLMTECKITQGGYTHTQREIDSLRQVLCGLRYNECIFYPFVGSALLSKFATATESNIKVMNPISDDLSMMARSLVPNMLQCASLNHSRNNLNLKLFEFGRVYLADSLPLTNLPVEEKHLTMLASGVDFDLFKQDVLTLVKTMNTNVRLSRSAVEFLHNGISADIFVEGQLIGSIGQVHPKIHDNFDLRQTTFIADINFDRLFALRNQTIRFEPIAKFPSVDRDFALVMDENVAAQDILDAFCELSLCERAELFDIYRSQALGQGKKSLAISVSFRDKNKTLSDSDIEKQVAKCLKNLNEKYSVVLR